MVYIEIVLVFNMIIHIVLVKNSSIILGVKINKKLLIISVILDSIYMLLYCYFSKYTENIKFIFGILIGALPNIKIDYKNVFKGTVLYLVQNFLLGGISQILYISSKIKIYHIFIILLVIIIITFTYKLISKNYFNINVLNYQIKIIDSKKTFYLKGYCDTGNFLVDECFVPVVFLNSKYKIGKNIKKLASQSINVFNTLDLYKVEEFYIKINEKYVKKDVYIAYSNINTEAMFGVSLLGGYNVSFFKMVIFKI